MQNMWRNRASLRPLGEVKASSGESSSASVSTTGSSENRLHRSDSGSLRSCEHSDRGRGRFLSSNSSSFWWCTCSAAEARGGSESDSTRGDNRCFNGRSSRRSCVTGKKRSSSDTESCVSLPTTSEEQETTSSEDGRNSNRRRTCRSCSAALRTIATTSSLPWRSTVTRRWMSRLHVESACPESSSVSRSVFSNAPPDTTSRSNCSSGASSSKGTSSSSSSRSKGASNSSNGTSSSSSSNGISSSSSKPESSSEDRRGSNAWRSPKKGETLSSSSWEASRKQKTAVSLRVPVAGEGDRGNADDASSVPVAGDTAARAAAAGGKAKTDTERVDDTEEERDGAGAAAVAVQSVVEKTAIISSNCSPSSLSLFSLTCPLAFTHAVMEALVALQQQQQLQVLCTAEMLLQNFVRKYETFIFDIDGVLLMGNRALAGVAEGLAFLREQGKRLLFLTNSASKSRRVCVEVLRNSGIFAEFHEVICSSYATALHLQMQYPHVKKVFMIGEAGLEEELRAAGFEVLHAADAAASHSRRKKELYILAADTQSTAALDAPSQSKSQATRKEYTSGAAVETSHQGAVGNVHPTNLSLLPPAIGANAPVSSPAIGANAPVSSPAIGANAPVSSPAIGANAPVSSPATASVIPSSCPAQIPAVDTALFKEKSLVCSNGDVPCAPAGLTDSCVSHTLADNACCPASPESGVVTSLVYSGSALPTPSETCTASMRRGSGGSLAVPQPSLTGTSAAEPSSAEGSSSLSPATFLYSAADRHSGGVTSCTQQIDTAFAATRSSLTGQGSATSIVHPPPCSSVSSASFPRCISGPDSPSVAPHSSAGTSKVGAGAPDAAGCGASFSDSSSKSSFAAIPPLPRPLTSYSSCIEDEESFSSLAYSLDPEVGAVVIGWDRRFDYFKLAVASLYLHRGDGTLPFLAANRDAFDVIEGWHMPANGAAVAALETAAGRAACCVGKPSPWLAKTVLQLHSLEPTSTVICGDRLDTDIAFGKHAGTDTCLTLTGCTTPQQLLQMPLSHPLRPDAVCPHIGLLRLLRGTAPL